MQMVQKTSKLNPKGIIAFCGNHATCSQNKFDSTSCKIGWENSNCHHHVYQKCWISSIHHKQQKYYELVFCIFFSLYIGIAISVTLHQKDMITIAKNLEIVVKQQK